MRLIIWMQKLRLPILLIFILSSFSVFAFGSDVSFLGLYMQGQKIGYASYREFKGTLHGKPVKESSSITKISAGLLGSTMTLSSSSTTVSNSAGKLVSMTFDEDSGGRSQTLSALFLAKTVKLTLNNTGTISHVVLPLPHGEITDDPLSGVVLGKMKLGTKKTIFVLDPTTASFVQNTVIFQGKKSVTVRGVPVPSFWVQIIDPRASTDVYVKPNGDLIKIEGAMGIEMIPMSKFDAVAGLGKSKIDLALGSRIVPKPALSTPGSLSDLKIRVTTAGKSSIIPSDPGQSVSGGNGDWTIDIHPVKFDLPSNDTISQASASMAAWTKPDTDIPSDEPRFKNLAKSIVGDTTDVGEAARKIQLWVNGQMTPDASIAVLRNANEVLDSKRGVCRDYSILTATLLRAAGIPARLDTGLVSWDGDFYYHAWDEFYDGKNWIGLDSTTTDAQLSAAHVELARGNVSQAYLAPFLQSPSITILATKY